MSNNLYRFGHDRGGFRHIPSLRTNAHMLGREWLAQLSGFECRHPSVCVSESAGFSGSWKMFFWRNFSVSPGLTSVVRRLRTLVISYTSLTRTSPERSLGSNASRKAARVRDSTRLALIQHLSPTRNGFPSLCLASNHKEALATLGEALTDFSRSPSSRFIEACQ